MWDTIQKLAGDGTTVLLTTQYLEEADRLADSIAILHGGRIVAEGSPDELKTMVPAGIVELEFVEPDELAAAQEALDGRYDINRVDYTLVVATTGSVAEMADMFIRLRDTGIEPSRLAKQTPTLDDVFFKILGEGKENSYASSN
jgi:ABC-2 type transport system ATP-binding protein